MNDSRLPKLKSDVVKTKARKNMTIYIVFLSLSMIIAIISVSYSFYIPVVKRSENSSKTVINISNNKEITIDGVVDFNNTEIMPGDTVSMQFKVTNTGDEVINSYSLNFSDMFNSFNRYEDLEYSIKCVSSLGKNCISKSTSTLPQDGIKILDSSSIIKGETHFYAIFITYKNSTENQNVDQYKRLSFKITLNDYVRTLNDAILKTNGGESYINIRKNPDYRLTEEEKTGIYRTKDSSGYTYYYRGKSTNNYIKVGNKLFRIVRINGDGTVRLILDTPEYTAKFNNMNICNPDATSGLDAISCSDINNENSIQNELNVWFESTIKNTEDNKYIVKSNFCNNIDYANGFTEFKRISMEGTPNLVCNGSYKLVGLLDASEVILAGGVYKKSNIDYYLYKENVTYWTSTPAYVENNTGYMLASSSLSLTPVNYTNSISLRPVINIANNTMIIGNGTYDSPYEIYREKTTKKLNSSILDDNGTLAKIRLNEYVENKTGIFGSNDNDGMTYFFSGNVKNNYVSFSGLIWRILRINGDGTVRLILDDYAKENDNYYEVSYNESIYCRKKSNINECNKYISEEYSETGIKNIIDKWYKDNIKNKNLVSLGKYCMKSNGLMCSSTIKENIGLITNNEMKLANSYVTLYNGWLLDNNDDILEKKKFKPVINLKSSVIVTSGNGYIDNPYKID